MIWSNSKPGERNYPILSLFDEMNRFFDEAGSTVVSSRSGAFNPKFDLRETATEYVLSGEFPGMGKDEINVELKDNTLTLSGEKKVAYEKKEGEVSYTERAYGAFSRTFPFDVEINEDAASAEMRDGILTIKIPKSEKVVKGGRKLDIKAN